MRFFFISENGDSGGVAQQVMREGHEALMYFKNPYARQTLTGIVPQVKTMRAGLNEVPDVVVFDMVGQGKEADKLRDAGFNVLGGGAWNDKLELDRKFAMSTMENLGIRSPRSYAFNSLSDCIEFAKTHRKLLVLKPFDNKCTAYTFVPKSQDQLIEFMTHLKKDKGVDGKMLLQEFVDGTEVSTEIWYAHGRPVPMPNSTFETKRFLHGEAGPSTGAATSLVFNYPKREPKIVQQSLKKLSLFLERTRYTGPLDINGIVRKGRFWGLEFTPRIGYNAITAWAQTLNEPLADVLHRVATGKTDPIKVKDGFGFSLRVSIPPYPFQPEDKILRKKLYQETRGQRIGGLNKGDMKNVYWLDAFKQGDSYYTGGFDGVVAEVTGFGDHAFEAERKAVELFKKMELPNKQARLGDGARLAESRMFEMGRQGYEMPPFDKPEDAPIRVEILAAGPMDETTKKVKEKKDETKTSTIGLAAKLGVKPSAFADPDVKSG